MEKIRIQELFREKKILKWITICLFAYGLVSVFMGVYRGATGSMDFQWDSAKVLALRINPYLESLEPSGIWEQYDFGGSYGALEANQFPSLLWLLVPFTVFTPQVANVVWALFNLLCGAIFLWGLRQTFLEDLGKEEFLFTVAVFVSGTPLRNCLAMGQHTLFSMAFLLLAIVFARKEKRILAGLFLSISYFKYVLVVPIALYFIYKRWFKELIISVIPHIVLTAFSAWWLQGSFMDMILQPLEVSSKLADQGAIDLGRWIGNGTASMAVAVLLGLALMLFIFFVPKGHDKELITLLMLVSLILMYHRFYDFFILVVPMALLLFNRESMILEKVCVGMSVVISYYIFSVFIHIWGLSGIQYEALTVVLAVFYYILTAVEFKNVIKLVLKGKKRSKGGE